MSCFQETILVFLPWSGRSLIQSGYLVYPVPETAISHPGWQIASAKYCTKILDIFAIMFAMRSEVLPENRYWTDHYLNETFQVGAELTMSFRKPENVPDGLDAKFQKYVDHEEGRIAAKLREFKYDIDALDTVYIIAGPPRSDEKTRVRIEKVSHRTLT